MNLSLLRKLWMLRASGKLPFCGIVLPRNWTCLNQKWYFSILDILKTLVSLDNWVRVLGHQIQNSWHRYAETLCKSSIDKNSAGKIEFKHFHWPFIRHLQTVKNQGAIELTEQGCSCQTLCCVWQSAYQMNISAKVCNYSADFPAIHK